jgi:hypothetical protein
MRGVVAPQQDAGGVVVTGPPQQHRGGIPTLCIVCDAQLVNEHELTGLCSECKLVIRNEGRASPAWAAVCRASPGYVDQRLRELETHPTDERNHTPGGSAVDDNAPS